MCGSTPSRSMEDGEGEIIRRCSLREPPAVKHSSTSPRLQSVQGLSSLRFPNVRGLTSLRLQNVRGKKEPDVRGSISFEVVRAGNVEMYNSNPRKV